MGVISPYAPYAVRHPVMFQNWEHLTFLHWRYDPAAIRPLVPGVLDLDTFDGAAFVGLTPFLLTNLRPPFTPALPWVSRFPETNVRTYVVGPEGERGVWFFTLEAGRLAAVTAASLAYGLPYRWADMRVQALDSRIEYASERHWPFPPAHCRVKARVGAAITPDELDNFLTARYRLYTFLGGRLAFAQIEHEPWPLRSAVVEELDQNLVERVGLPLTSGLPMVHHSPDICVRVGRPTVIPGLD
jgi:uncharacterized protein YqjF (DUF2071 family)